MDKALCGRSGFMKRLAALSLVVLLVLGCLPVTGAASNEETENDFLAVKSGIVDSFNGSGADTDLEMKIKVKSPELNFAESAALLGASLVVKCRSTGDSMIAAFAVKYLGINAVYCSVDRSPDGIGLYVPKLDENYYLIDNALADTLLQTAAEELSFHSWGEASEWIKSLSVSDVFSVLLDFSEEFSDSFELNMTLTAPSTVEYPPVRSVRIRTEEELFTVLTGMENHLPELLKSMM